MGLQGSSSGGRRGDVDGAGLVAEVLVAVGAGPQVGAAFEGGVAPAGVGLQPMMPPAQGCDVAGTGGPAAVVFEDVVTVGAVSVGA